MTFEQLPRESDKAFAAFQIYLNLGAERSLSLVAKTLAKSPALMTKWAQQHNWITRAVAYDASEKNPQLSTHNTQLPITPPCNDATVQTIASALPNAAERFSLSASGGEGRGEVAHSSPISNANQKPQCAPLPFHPASNESHKAFECFLCYLDIGQNRSFAEVARRTGVNLNSVKMWAHRFDWRERIQSYNTHLLKIRIDAVSATREQMAKVWAERTATFKEREWTATEKLLAAAQKVLDTFDQRDPAEISLAEVARALEIASKIGRLATGLATEKTEVTGENGGPIRIEFETALKKIYGEVVDITPNQIENKPSQQP